jgi:hypothetical protein
LCSSSEWLSFWTLFVVRNSKWIENTTILKLDMFLSVGERRDVSTLFRPLDRGLTSVTGQSPESQ